MPDLELSKTELAAGTAIAMDMAREQRRGLRRKPESTGSAVVSILFVAITSIGMLVLMLFLGN